MSALALLERDAVAHPRADRDRDEREPLPLRRVRGHRDAVTARGAGTLMPRLVKTEAVIEGRVEERWTLVEDDDTPE